MLKHLLFPKPLREFPGQRWARIGVRTWHLLAMGWLLGGTAAGIPLESQYFGFYGTLLSGLVFIALELYASCVFLLQLKGLAVVAKLLLFCAAWLSPANGLPFMVVAVVIGGISSHMQGKYRYFSPFHGRIVKE